MSRNSSYLKVGIFSLAAFAILAAGLIFFGISQAFQPVLECATYFDHSVQGLGKGSAVSFRGFHVGQVTSISVADGTGVPGFRNEATPKKLVKVTFIVTPELLTGNASSDPEQAAEFIMNEMASGLRCFFSFQGVSGISNLNLDYIDLAPQNREPDPFGPPGPKGGAPMAPEPPSGAAAPQGSVHQDILTRGGEYDGRLLIPSAPGYIMEVGETLNQILRSLREVNFAAISRQAESLLSNLSSISGQLNRESGGFSDKLLSSMDKLEQAATDVSRLAVTAEREISSMSAGARLQELEAALKDARRTLSRLDSVLRIPQATLPATMDNLRVMSENLRTLSETAKDYPSSLILGSPPPRMDR
ncbi:MAG: MlaD family protein [Deltaproteobacteria bacterium]|jgi:phospholipid/cholesterol/gamma-HCH transport system substrate-binding protein/paraquat-inducible protein B|nr:MlaD family protein [Deltaproteobacteria bacterium]